MDGGGCHRLVLAGGDEDDVVVSSYHFISKTIMMKKITTLLLTGLLMLACQTMYAQNNDRLVLLNISNIGADKAAIRATRDFWRKAGESKAEKWYRSPGGFIAEYTQGPVSGRYQYDSQGRPVYSILTYTQWQLPKEVRQEVRREFYDYSIGWVKEVSQDGATAYVVHLDDSVSWKEIAVQDGDIRVLQEYWKQ